MRRFAIGIQQSFVEHTASPYAAVTLLAANIAVGTYVGIAGHEVVGHFLNGRHDC